MYFTLFLSMSLLNYGFTQKKKKKKNTKEMVLLNISISRVPMIEPAAADEIQTKNKKYDTQRKRLLLP